MTTDAASGLDQYLSERRAEVESALAQYLPAPPHTPPVLADAIRYCLLAGGKRLRPLLTLAAADAVGGVGARSQAMPAACAIEMIHTYSLVHDDLPAMDDDSLRRGRPTLHMAAGDGLAILAGDGLQAEAFRLLACEPVTDDPQVAMRKLRVLEIIAHAAGPAGMVGGQAIDLEAAGAFGAKLSAVSYQLSAISHQPSAISRKPTADSRQPQAKSQEPRAESRQPTAESRKPRAGSREPFTADDLEQMHARKTGALIRASAVAGAVIAGAGEPVVAAIDRYASEIGLAFQIVDDLLDVEAATDTLGKTAGKDAAAGKPTYPALFGIARSRELAAECLTRAEAALAAVQLEHCHLAGIARRIVARRS